MLSAKKKQNNGNLVLETVLALHTLQMHFHQNFPSVFSKIDEMHKEAILFP